MTYNQALSGERSSKWHETKIIRPSPLMILLMITALFDLLVIGSFIIYLWIAVF